MAGEITVKVTVMKGGMARLALKSPIYIPGPVEPQFGPGRYIYFEGFSVDETGKQHDLDTTVAYRQTCLRVFEYLRRYGKSFPWGPDHIPHPSSTQPQGKNGAAGRRLTGHVGEMSRVR